MTVKDMDTDASEPYTLSFSPNFARIRLPGRNLVIELSGGDLDGMKETIQQVGDTCWDGDEADKPVVVLIAE